MTALALARVDEPALDALSANVALIDHRGTIVHVNRGWRAFARANGGDLTRTDIGANYLSVLASTKGSEQAAQVLKALSEVLSGKQPKAILHYPCHSPDLKRWFVVLIDGISGYGAKRERHALVTHLDLFDIGFLPESSDGSSSDLQRVIGLTAHDLQGPLRVLAAMMSDDLPHNSADWEQLRAGVVNRLDHCRSLLRELIDHVQLSRMQPAMAAFDLAGLIDECVTMADLPPTVRVQLRGGPITLHSDRNALRHVLLNLIRNAARHNDKPTPVIRISSEALADGVAIEVADNGPGIAPAKRAQLFDSQLSRRQSNTGGLGVGLSLCQETVGRFGGQLSIADSNLGGAAFRFSFRG